jgi:hypothetical protein
MRYVLALAAAVSLLFSVSCRGARPGLDPQALPPEARADYDVFARRCSKCHALSRPLDSGITSDAYWTLYVAKMRHLPGSGITEDDATAILRFLRIYAASERQRQKEVEK